MGRLAEMIHVALEAKYQNKGRKFTRKDWDQLLGHCQVQLLAKSLHENRSFELTRTDVAGCG